MKNSLNHFHVPQGKTGTGRYADGLLVPEIIWPDCGRLRARRIIEGQGRVGDRVLAARVRHEQRRLLRRRYQHTIDISRRSMRQVRQRNRRLQHRANQVADVDGRRIRIGDRMVIDDDRRAIREAIHH